MVQERRLGSLQTQRTVDKYPDRPTSGTEGHNDTHTGE